MSDDSNIIRRDERGRLLPGGKLNPHGRPIKPRLDVKYTREAIMTRLDAVNFDPIMEMVEIARDPQSSPYLRFECAKELASFLIAKRKSVVITDDNGEQATIRIAWDNAPTDPPQEAIDSAREQFTDAMNDAHTRIVDAVMSDDKDEC